MRSNYFYLFLLLSFVVVPVASENAGIADESGREVGVKKRHNRHYSTSYHRSGFRSEGKGGKQPGDRRLEYKERGMVEVSASFRAKEAESKTAPSQAKPPPDEEKRLNQVEKAENPRDSKPSVDESHFLCPSLACTEDLERSKQLRILQIKHQILKETRIESPPNMTSFVLPQNPRLQRIIDEVNEDMERIEQHSKRFHNDFLSDDPNIKSEKGFIRATICPSRVKIPDGRNVHYFNLSREHSCNIAMAELHFWLKPTSNPDAKDHVALVSVYKVDPSKFPQDYNRMRSIINQEPVSYKGTGVWAKVDIFSLVREWLLYPEDNLGFVIKAYTVSGVALNVDTVEDDPSHAPLLELDVKEERNDRRKRFANNRICSNKKIERECCRYPLTVNFMLYRFDFIVAPKKYVANYCRGECPFLYAQKYPHSTIVQQMISNNTNLSPGPCCGARDLAPLKMVYYDGHKIKIAVINDMVVKQCSCT